MTMAMTAKQSMTKENILEGRLRMDSEGDRLGQLPNSSIAKKSKKIVDLDSYFKDLPNESNTATAIDQHRKSSSRRSKSSVYIVRSTRKTSHLKTSFRSSRRRNPSSLTVPPSRDENNHQDDDDDEDEDEESESDDGNDDEWVREKWNQLIDRQRSAEADVRRTILNRDRLDPLELSRWLDSEDTCTLPLPNLGVRLRMIENQ